MSRTVIPATDISLSQLLVLLEQLGISGTGIEVSPDHIFTGNTRTLAETARDTYFTNNPSERINGLIIIIAFGGTAERQIWDGSNWDVLDQQTLSQVDRDTLDSITALTTNNLLIGSMAGVESIPVEYNASLNRVISSLDWEFPADSIFVSENLKLGGANLAFSVGDIASDRNGFLVAYTYDTTGNVRPFIRALTTSSTTPSQSDKSSNFNTTTCEHTLVSSSNYLITKYTLESTDTALATVTLRRDSHTGAIISQYRNVSFTANTPTDVFDAFNDNETPFFTNANEIYYLTVEGVTLKGKGTPNVNFEPFYESEGFTWAQKDVALLEDLTFQHPIITSFSLTGFNTQVDAGTVINGQQSISWTITNLNNIQGDLTLEVAGNEISSSISSSSSVYSFTFPATTLNAGESVALRLSGVDTHGNVFSRTYTIRARVQSEALYYGVVSDITPANIDETTLTEYDILAGSQFDASFNIPANSYAVLLSPADKEIASIVDKTFTQEILNDFTKTSSAKQISSQSYDLYTHQNQSSITGILSTRVRIA